jgi:hypothetical protein
VFFPTLINLARVAGSSSNWMMPSRISALLFRNIPVSPMISESNRLLYEIVGTPVAIASIGGMPRPSHNDGNANTVESVACILVFTSNSL